MLNAHHTFGYRKANRSVVGVHLTQISQLIYTMSNSKMLSNNLEIAREKKRNENFEQKKSYLEFLKQMKGKIKALEVHNKGQSDQVIRVKEKPKRKPHSFNVIPIRNPSLVSLEEEEEEYKSSDE